MFLGIICSREAKRKLERRHAGASRAEARTPGTVDWRFFETERLRNQE
jgi:hypothetical protein